MKDIVSAFEYAIQKGRISHLYLLTGSAGITKRNIALELAYLVFKAEKDYPNLKNQVINLNHPNLLYISKDGLSIKKDQVLGLQEEFSKTSLVSGSRIYIIESAETMSVAASNSLLKFLEEPKDNQTIGFLLTDDFNLIMPTIRSRSQVILIEDENEQNYIESLISNEIDEKNAYILTLMTKNFEEAIMLFQDPIYQRCVASFDGLVTWLLNPVVPLSMLINDLSKNFINEKKYLSLVLEMLSNVMLDVLHTHMNQKIRLIFMKEQILQMVTKVNALNAEILIIKIHQTIKNLQQPINVLMALQALAIDIEDILKHANT